jgi:hypothetical protein
LTQETLSDAVVAAAETPWAPIGTGLPDPEQQPLMRIPEAGRKAYGLGRAASYAAAARGEIPTIHQGRRKLVPTAVFRRKLGLDGGDRHVTAA